MHLFFPFFFDSININIYFFIIEAYSSGNCNALRSRISVPPYVILVLFPIEDNTVIVRFSFIRTGGDCFCRLNKFEINTRLWEVIADWKASLIQQQRSSRFRDDSIVHFDHNMTSGGNDINSFIRVLRVNIDLGILLKPGI